ncbi:hypothetical protein M9H77_23809 [Catharanthus roseus]|uniref:Uncharacterized protein n=1 Tax=Catharanthus roseus TaxID=4058 RepID=A0ACC0AYF4_CATRO|nr:hypothetical protein M9H77_23809 [Catharanthus roseus]
MKFSYGVGHIIFTNTMYRVQLPHFISEVTKTRSFQSWTILRKQANVPLAHFQISFFQSSMAFIRLTVTPCDINWNFPLQKLERLSNSCCSRSGKFQEIFPTQSESGKDHNKSGKDHFTLESFTREVSTFHRLTTDD